MDLKFEGVDLEYKKAKNNLPESFWETYSAFANTNGGKIILGIDEKNTKRKETHMNSLPNHHFQNKSFYQLSFDGGHLTQYGGLIFFQELFSQLKLKERISKYLVTNDQRRYCRYSDSDILVQFLFQLLTGQLKHAKGGRKPKLSLEDLLMATLQYVREYRTYEEITADFGIHESNLIRRS
ncbi:IS1381%2C transposase OrfA [Streptococcus pneumoniae]|nr:IS1381%2C transposase OrfA [Streptococcus pneumoniae]